jgi:hypothetical protein
MKFNNSEKHGSLKSCSYATLFQNLQWINIHVVYFTDLGNLNLLMVVKS